MKNYSYSYQKGDRVAGRGFSLQEVKQDTAYRGVFSNNRAGVPSAKKEMEDTVVAVPAVIQKSLITRIPALGWKVGQT